MWRVRVALSALLALIPFLIPFAVRADGAAVLFVNSYHQGYEWSDDIQRGIEETFVRTKQNVVVHYMDTKRNQSQAFKVEAGKRARRLVDELKPKVVIVSDDNAVQYLVADSLMNGPVPVVFCGVNWDAAKYGLPNDNVTGMIEVSPVRELLAVMRKFAAGDRVAILSADTESERIHVDAFLRKFPQLDARLVRFVSTMAGFEEAFAQANAEADILLFLNNAGIVDWDADRARAVVREQGRIVSGTFDHWMSPFVVFSMFKLGEEQGRWAARAALKILTGAKPSSIPVAANREGLLTLNAGLARRLGIALPADLLALANEVIDD